MFEVKETSTFIAKSKEQADYIAELYSKLHALIICENSEHSSYTREVTHDLREIDENVMGHAMRYGKPHDDGRECMYHHRLGVWISVTDSPWTGNSKQCLRPVHDPA